MIDYGIAVRWFFEPPRFSPETPTYEQMELIDAVEWISAV